jgi:hypothetical protein
MGPWRLTNRNEICADKKQETFIAEIFDENEAWAGNARLIAATPELLQTCEMSLQDAKDALSGDWQPTKEGWESIIEHLSRVIAKAYGKTS